MKTRHKKPLASDIRIVHLYKKYPFHHAPTIVDILTYGGSMKRFLWSNPSVRQLIANNTIFSTIIHDERSQEYTKRPASNVQTAQWPLIDKLIIAERILSCYKADARVYYHNNPVSTMYDWTNDGTVCKIMSDIDEYTRILDTRVQYIFPDDELLLIQFRYSRGNTA